MINWRKNSEVVLLLGVVSLCLFEFVLRHQIGVFSEFEAVLLSAQWMLLICLTVWLGAFLFLTFCLDDLLLIGLLLLAITYSLSSSPLDAITLLAAVMLGKGARLSMRNEELKAKYFLIGLVTLLAFSSWWHLRWSNHYYRGARWMGLWDNPNHYGMLMSVGVVMTAALLADTRWKAEHAKVESRKPSVDRRLSLSLRIILFIAAGMMAVGLLCSYSRGSWLGTAIGLLYLAKIYRKFKWKYVLPVALLASIAVLYFWNATPDSSPWFVRRMDFGRASAQHRVAAWKAAFEMMRDHPFGVGWNKAVETYEKDYSPPDDGAEALATNGYLMLGAQLGIPALICFVAYAALCFRPRLRRTSSSSNAEKKTTASVITSYPSLQITCRATVLAMMVTLWFDGGLFKLPTASVFWILLELGRANSIGTMQGATASASKKAVVNVNGSPIRACGQKGVTH